MMKKAFIALLIPFVFVSASAGGDWKPSVRWRGFNMMDSRWDDPDATQYDREEYFIFMREFGFNFMRLPLSYRKWISDQNDWMSIDPSADRIRRIDRAIELGRRYGVHIQICFHRAPGYTVAGGVKEPASLWSDTGAQEACAKHWAFFAERYKGVPNDFLSFNLVNEPPVLKRGVYRAFTEKMLSAIRKIDPGRFVMIDGESGRDRAPAGDMLDIPSLGHATRGYEPYAVSHWKTEAYHIYSPDAADSLPAWPRDWRAPAGVLSGTSKPHLRAPLVFGGIGGPGRMVVRFGKVSGDVDVGVYSSGRRIAVLELRPRKDSPDWKDVVYHPQWSLSQGTHCGVFTVDVDPSVAEVAFLVDKGDWAALDSVEWICGNDRVTAKCYNKFSSPVNFRQKLRGWRGSARGFFPVGAGGGWDEPRYRDPGKEYIYRMIFRPCEAALAAGRIVMIGEMGACNRTPHVVSLAQLEDYLQLAKERGMGWALWHLSGECGVLDSGRRDVDYEDWRGHKLDRQMLLLLQTY